MIFLIGFIACQTTQETGTIEQEGLLISSAEYQLDWVEEHTVSETLILENDLGFQIEIQKGYLSSYSVRIYPCSTTSARFVFPIGTAWAGHSDILVPGNWVQPWVENILNLETIQREKIFEEHPVCSVVYTIARADGSSGNLPTDIDLNNLSISLEGTWVKDGQEGTFLWTSSLPAERVFSLDDCISEGTTGTGIRVQLTRNISTAFDEIDFATVDDQVGALQVMTNLVQDSQLTCSLH
jgi:hypothetical protein